MFKKIRFDQFGFVDYDKILPGKCTQNVHYFLNNFNNIKFYNRFKYFHICIFFLYDQAKYNLQLILNHSYIKEMKCMFVYW